MAQRKQVRERGADGDMPCRGEAGAEKSSICPLFARAAGRLAEIVRISAGQAADRTFDAMLCPVPMGDVAEWKSPLAPGHWAAFTFYGADAFEPLQRLYVARAQSYGIKMLQPTSFSVERMSDAESARSFLYAIGLREIRIYAEQLGYHLSSAAEWWNLVSSSVLGRQTAQLPVNQVELFMAEHLAEVTALAADAPLWVHVPTFFALGCRPRE